MILLQVTRFIKESQNFQLKSKIRMSFSQLHLATGPNTSSVS